MQPLGLVPPVLSPHCCLAMSGTDYMVILAKYHHMVETQIIAMHLS